MTGARVAEHRYGVPERNGPGRGLALSLATIGQILVRLGQLERAEEFCTARWTCASRHNSTDNRRRLRHTGADWVDPRRI